MSLDRKLARWESAGLIDGTTRARIRAFEQSERAPIALYALGVLGAATLALGILSVIAANWDGIPGTVKLAVDLLIGLGLAVATYIAVRRDAGWPAEVLITVFYGFTLASIALVGQVYQLTAEFRSVAPLATRILERLHGDDLVVHEGPLENGAGLTFYTGRQVYVVDGQRGDLHFGSRFPEAQGLFWGGEEFARLWQGRHRIFFVTDRPADESVLRLITPQTRHLIGHEGRRWLFTNRPE